MVRWFSGVWLSGSYRGLCIRDMSQMWFICVWHGSHVAKYWFSCGSVVWVAWFRCCAVVCGAVAQAMVNLCETWLRCGLVVHGMVQRWLR